MLTADDWAFRTDEVQDDLDMAESHPRRNERDVEALRVYMGWLRGKRELAVAKEHARAATAKQIEGS